MADWFECLRSRREPHCTVDARAEAILDHPPVPPPV